jgi:hypothetical protein
MSKSINIAHRLSFYLHRLRLGHIHATEHIRAHLLTHMLRRCERSKIIGLIERLRLIHTCGLSISKCLRLCNADWLSICKFFLLYRIVLRHPLLLPELRTAKKVELVLSLLLVLLREHRVNLRLLLYHWIYWVNGIQ